MAVGLSGGERKKNASGKVTLADLRFLGTKGGESISFFTLPTHSYMLGRSLYFVFTVETSDTEFVKLAKTRMEWWLRGSKLSLVRESVPHFAAEVLVVVFLNVLWTAKLSGHFAKSIFRARELCILLRLWKF